LLAGSFFAGWCLFIFMPGETFSGFYYILSEKWTWYSVRFLRLALLIAASYPDYGDKWLRSVHNMLIFVRRAHWQMALLLWLCSGEYQDRNFRLLKIKITWKRRR
jgi:hypothetical protein